MINKLIIKNFRCFRKTTIQFNDTSILVGSNNAGKSTVIEALKIIATVVKRYKNLTFHKAPDWVIGETDNGVSPSLDNQNISDKGIFNYYDSAPAVIDAFFSNGGEIRAYVGEGLSVFALIFVDGSPVRNAKEVKQINLPSVEVLPQISALLEKERKIDKKTVNQNIGTRLTSRNFRNQLYYYKDTFPLFKTLVESSWEGLQVNPVEINEIDQDQLISFFVRDNDFEAEIGWMGHGLQMWVQCMWFISRCSKDAIVILDEPDVYMHADLQRRLIRLITPLFSQLIIATHSIEIMEEVLPESIIPIDHKKSTIRSVGNYDILQKIVDEMGSIFNLDLARLFVSRRFIVCEGPKMDRKILAQFQRIMYPNSLTPITTFPYAFVEGWGGWQKAVALASLFNINKFHVICYCLFDSDYHTENQIRERKQEATNHRINLHIWERKEIENYVLNPDAIFRFINANKKKGKITKEILQNKIDQLVNESKEDIQDQIATGIQNEDKSIELSTARKQASVRLKSKWDEPLNVVPGKDFLKKLSSWAVKEFGVRFQALNIIPYFKPEEIPEEMKIVITAIINGSPM